METSHRTPPPKDFDQPIVWLPRSFDTSPSGLLWAPKDWGPLGGHLLGMSYGQSILYHVMTEEVDGLTQGAVFKLPMRFASGCMRGRFNPIDGQLYICGLKGWQTSAGKISAGKSTTQFTNLAPSANRRSGCAGHVRHSRTYATRLINHVSSTRACRSVAPFSLITTCCAFLPISFRFVPVVHGFDE